MSNLITDDCSSGLHDYCTPCHCECHYKDIFELTLDEAKALNFFLRLHCGLMKEHPEQYTQILRLVNGIGQFVDSHDSK